MNAETQRQLRQRLEKGGLPSDVVDDMFRTVVKGTVAGSGALLLILVSTMEIARELGHETTRLAVKQAYTALWAELVAQGRIACSEET